MICMLPNQTCFGPYHIRHAASCDMTCQTIGIFPYCVNMQGITNSTGREARYSRLGSVQKYLGPGGWPTCSFGFLNFFDVARLFILGARNEKEPTRLLWVKNCAIFFWLYTYFWNDWGTFLPRWFQSTLTLGTHDRSKTRGKGRFSVSCPRTFREHTMSADIPRTFYVHDFPKLGVLFEAMSATGLEKMQGFPAREIWQSWIYRWFSGGPPIEP